jgi:hypothetical protein
MPIRHLGRHDQEIYEFVCDADGCNSSYEFRVTQDHWNGWQKLVVYTDGDHTVTKYLCPKHHLA